jgi:hypothetical protein
LTSNEADIESVTLSATGVYECYGVYAIEADSPNPIRYSTISGSTASAVAATLHLSTASNHNLMLGATCTASIDENGTPLDAFCKPHPTP